MFFQNGSVWKELVSVLPWIYVFPWIYVTTSSPSTAWVRLLIFIISSSRSLSTLLSVQCGSSSRPCVHKTETNWNTVFQFAQGRTGHLAYRAYARWAVQYWGRLGPFGALQMHQHALKCLWGPKNAPKCGLCAIHHIGDFWGILEHFVAFLGP